MTTQLPITETLRPADQGELAASVRQCCGDDVAVYPVGGGTSLSYGLPARKPGVALSLAGLQRVIDYPARDMTVTVESGMTMRALAELLATERQHLPIDVPQSSQATVGGVIATNFNGPRRYGYGTVRDYVLGISAVDGQGRPFKGGGRVVKNVAGYDFCKLLTGSLGTLGVITQVTLKLKPLCERRAMVVCSRPDEQSAEQLLAALVNSQTTPAAIELLAGPAWRTDPALASFAPRLASPGLLVAVLLEGTDTEVRWMVDQLGQEWWSQGVADHQTLYDEDAQALLGRLVEFPAEGAAEGAVPLVLKASLVPSGTTGWIREVRAVDPDCSLQAHAGNGIVLARLTKAPAGGIAKALIGRLQSAAAAHGGSVVVLAGNVGEATHASIWGPLSSPQWLMKAVKQEFDPRNILNPDRFVY